MHENVVFDLSRICFYDEAPVSFTYVFNGFNDFLPAKAYREAHEGCKMYGNGRWEAPSDTNLPWKDDLFMNHLTYRKRRSFTLSLSVYLTLTD